jgi:predicted permease
VSEFFRNVRMAARTWAKNPGFALVAILTLALAIGANTAAFSAINSVLLRALPFANPQSVALITNATADGKDSLGSLSYQHFTLINDRNQSFSSVAAFTNEDFTLTTPSSDPEQLHAARVSWNFFDVLGIHPMTGRFFLPAEDRPEGNRVIVLGHRFWMRQFGGSRTIIGQTITLNSEPYEVAGVLGPDFVFPFLHNNVDVFTPRVYQLNLASPGQIDRGAGFLDAVARLRPGVTLPQAQAELHVLDQQFREARPNNPDADAKQMAAVRNFHARAVADVRPALLVLFGVVVLVLLVACANVTSLLLSQAITRKKEMTVRLALGASHAMITRQLITESLLLAFAGGVAGAALGYVALRMLSSFATGDFEMVANVSMDWRVLVFTAGLSISCAILFGVAPALQSSKADMSEILRSSGRGTSDSRTSHRSRKILVVGQIAISMMLLVGAGLMIRSFIRLVSVNVGFDPKNVLTMQTSLPPARYGTKPAMISFYHNAIDMARRVPGVESATISSALPLAPSRVSPMHIEGQPEVPLPQEPFIYVQTISPDYAKVFHVPLVRGREFTEQDDSPTPLVGIVNETFARKFWPNADPIGEHVRIGRQTVNTEIVGVFGDERNIDLASPAEPEILLPFPELPWATLHLSVRTSVEPRSVASALRQGILRLDSGQPVTDVQTLNDLVASGRAQPRFIMFLLTAFSTIAFVLAIVGIYGVISYSVAQRTQELAVRIALGATPDNILRLVMGSALRLALAGIAIGLMGGLVLAPVMSRQLYKNPAIDPVALGASAVLFLAVALTASYLPSRRAMRVDPLTALREE